MDTETHDSLLDMWDKGFVHIGEVNQKSIHYITKYMVNDIHLTTPVDKPFNIMSKRPGLGNAYIEKMQDWHLSHAEHETGKEGLYVFPGGKKYKLPEYYMNRIYTPTERERINQRLADSGILQEIEEQKALENRGVNYYESKLSQMRAKTIKIKRSAKSN